MAEKYAIQSDEELETLRLKAADRTLAEDSADAKPGDLIFMVAETVTPTIQGDSVAFFARTNRFQLMARLKQYYLVECLSRAIDYRLNFQKFVPSSLTFHAWRSSLSVTFIFNHIFLIADIWRSCAGHCFNWPDVWCT